MTFLIKDAWDEINRSTGIRPDSSDWQKHADHMMMNMGLTPSEIMAALKIGLASQWHRGKVMDRGLAHIRYNYHQLVSASKESGSIRGSSRGLSYSHLFKLGKHQRWEVQNHIWMHDYKLAYGTTPSLQLLKEYSDKWYAANVSIADDWVDCPICQDEIANKMMGLERPSNQKVDVSKLIQKFSELPKDDE